jgi:cell division protein FtsB
MAYNITKVSGASTVKKLAFLVTVIICIIAINALARSIYDLWHKQDLVVKAKEELKREKQKNQELKAELAYVKSDEFIESQARDKLFMVKPGEADVIVPENLIKKKEDKKEVKLEPWQEWINLIVKGK